jgi:hypothetical protein
MNWKLQAEKNDIIEQCIGNFVIDKRIEIKQE